MDLKNVSNKGANVSLIINKVTTLLKETAISDAALSHTILSFFLVSMFRSQHFVCVL